jgi:hypothetical protein
VILLPFELELFAPIQSLHQYRCHLRQWPNWTRIKHRRNHPLPNPLFSSISWASIDFHLQPLQIRIQRLTYHIRLIGTNHVWFAESLLQTPTSLSISWADKTHDQMSDLHFIT